MASDHILHDVFKLELHHRPARTSRSPISCMGDKKWYDICLELVMSVLIDPNSIVMYSDYWGVPCKTFNGFVQKLA